MTCGRAMKWVSGLVLLAVLAGCGAKGPPGVDRREISRVVGDVMSARTPISTADKMAALAELEQFIRATSYKSRRVANVIHQLADLYLNVELQTYEQELARFRQGLPDYVSTPTPRPRHDRSIPLYLKLLEEYPARRANHEVYYQLARAYAGQADVPRQEAMLKSMLQGTPGGRHEIEAWYRLGELAFDQVRYLEAARWYEKVLAARAVSRRLRDYATYKRTWAFYLEPELQKAAKSAVAFLDEKQVLRGNKRVLDSQTMPEPDWERVREVVAILSRTLHDLGGTKALARLFPEERDYLHMIYRKLGEVEGQMGNTQGAIATYEAFIRRYPNTPEAPTFLGYVVDRHMDDGNVDAAVSVRVRLVDQYGPGGRWWKKQTAATRRAAGDGIRKTTHRLARHFHSVAQESRRPADYQRAIKWYQRYLDTYPEASDAGLNAFLLGEARFETGDNGAAAKAYVASAYDYARHKKSGEAAYAAVFVLERALSATNRDSAAYGTTLGALADAFMRMVEAYPRELRLPAAYERISSLLFAEQDFARLYDLTDKIIRYGPRTRDLHVKAWRALGEAALETERFERAKEALTQALTYLKDDPQASAEIRKLLAAVAISRANAPGISRVEAAGALTEAAELLGEDDPLARTARVDAALALADAGSVAEALAAIGSFRADYPQSEHLDRLARALIGIGESALESGDVGTAQTAWDRYREWFGGTSPERDRAVFQLEARGHLEGGDLDAANIAYSRILESHEGDPPEELIDRLAGIRFKQAAALLEKKTDRALDLFASIADDLPTSRVAPAALEGVVGGARERDPKRALEAADQLLAFYPATEAATAVRSQYADLLDKAGRPHDAGRHLLDRAKDETQTEKQEVLIVRAVGYFITAKEPAEAARAWRQARDLFGRGDDHWVQAEHAAIRMEVGNGTDPSALTAAQAQQVEARMLELLYSMQKADTLGPHGRQLAGEVWLQRAEIQRATCEAVALVAPLKENLAKKQAALKAALGSYSKAIRFRSRDVTLNATRQMGELFEVFAVALLGSPTPAELTGEQAEIYRKALEKKAAPYRARAIKTHLKNLEHARDGVITPDVEESLRALARLQPEWYDRPELGVVPVHGP